MSFVYGRLDLIKLMLERNFLLCCGQSRELVETSILSVSALMPEVFFLGLYCLLVLCKHSCFRSGESVTLVAVVVWPTGQTEL